MIELLIGLIELGAGMFVIIFGINEVIMISKRVRQTISVDNKMLTVGRILSWGAVIIVTFANKKFNHNVYHLVWELILICVVIFGSRLYTLSFRVRQENKNTKNYPFDQWVENIYRKYLEPLWE